MYKNTVNRYPNITKVPTTIFVNHIQNRRYSPSTTNQNYAYVHSKSVKCKEAMEVEEKNASPLNHLDNE